MIGHYFGTELWPTFLLLNRNTKPAEFIFAADRLIRLAIEEGLNLLQSETKEVVTPSGKPYQGVEFSKNYCGVSVNRSGQAMEKALRDCFRSIRMGKINIEIDEETNEGRVLCSKLPTDIEFSKVLLLYPAMSTANTVTQVIKVLKKNRVLESNIIVVTLFTTPWGKAAVDWMQWRAMSIKSFYARWLECNRLKIELRDFLTQNEQSLKY